MLDSLGIDMPTAFLLFLALALALSFEFVNGFVRPMPINESFVALLKKARYSVAAGLGYIYRSRGRRVPCRISAA